MRTSQRLRQYADIVTRYRKDPKTCTPDERGEVAKMMLRAARGN